jgi:very-short-patch-repair endonuclease
MSLNSKNKLTEIAKNICRELRKNSTESEKIFWKAIRNRKLLGKKFYRQYPIFYDLNGNDSFFAADYYSYDCKLIIEIDGNYHKFRLKKDRERTEIINYLSLKVIRFSNEEIINDLDEVLIKLKSVILS